MSIADKIIERYKSDGTGLADKVLARLGVESKSSKLKKVQEDAEKYRLEAERAGSLNPFSSQGRSNLAQGAKSILTTNPFTTVKTIKEEGKNAGSALKSFGKDILTGNTTETIYDLVYQKQLDEQGMKQIEENNRKVSQLQSALKTAPNNDRARIEKAIKLFSDDNTRISNEAGGKLKDKTNAQLVGQSLGTALELVPLLGVSSIGTRVGLKTLGSLGVKSAVKSLASRTGGKVFGQAIPQTGKALTREAMLEGGGFGGTSALAGSLSAGETDNYELAKSTLIGIGAGVFLSGVLAKFLSRGMKTGVAREVPKDELDETIQGVQDVTGKVTPEDERAIFETMQGGATKDEILESTKQANTEKKLAKPERLTVVTERIESETGKKLSLQEEAEVLKDLEAGKTTEEILDIYKPKTPEEIIAKETDETKITSLIKGKVPEDEIPFVSKALANTNDPETVARIMDEYNPEMSSNKRNLDIAESESESTISRILKESVSEEDIPKLSKILKNVEEPDEVGKILKPYTKEKSVLSAEKELSGILKEKTKPLKEINVEKLKEKDFSKTKESLETELKTTDEKLSKLEKAIDTSKGARFDDASKKFNELSERKESIEKTLKALNKKREEISQRETKGVSKETPKETTKQPAKSANMEKVEKTPAASETTNPLNYKTAEEYVKAQGTPVYHGTPDFRFAEEFDAKKTGYYPELKEALPDNKEFEATFGKVSTGFKGDRPIYFTDNKQIAKSYSEKPAYDYRNSIPSVLERHIKLKNPLTVDANGALWRKFEATIDGKKIVGTRDLEEFAKNKGYDGIIVKNVNDPYSTIDGKIRDGIGTNYVVFNPSQLKTKSQLIDEWNKAQKKIKKESTIAPKTQKPAQEAPKQEKKVSVPKEEKTTVKSDIPTKKKTSIIAERLNNDLPQDFKIDDQYDPKSISAEADKASKLIESDKKGAIKKALDPNTNPMERDAILIELSEIAKRDGDYSTLSDLFSKRAELIRSNAQSLNMEKASVLLNPQEKYMRDIVNMRLSKVKVSGKDITSAEAAVKKGSISKEVRETVRKSFKIEDAQALFDSLIC